MKYTKEHLWDEVQNKHLPYINLVMQGINIKKGIEVKVDSDGSILLFKPGKHSITLFDDYFRASKKETYSPIKYYKDFIKLEKTKEMVETTIYSLVGEGE